MTDTVVIDDRLCADLSGALHNVRWLTPREVQAKVAHWPLQRVRHALRDMAEAGDIETRQGGTDARPVREYRKWK